MKPRIRGKGANNAGVALVHTFLLVLVVGGLIAVTLAAAKRSYRNAEVRRSALQAEYLSEGAVEVAKKELQTALANGSSATTSGTAIVAGTPVDLELHPTRTEVTRTDAAGIQTLVAGYECEATARVDRRPTHVRRFVNIEATWLFQYAVFSAGDLEIRPSSDTTIRGRIHTNRDLYLGPEAALTLDTNCVHAVGNIYRSRKDGSNVSAGSVAIRNWVANPFDATEPIRFARMKSKLEMEWAGVTTKSGYDSRFTEGYDRNQDGTFTDSDDFPPFGPGAQSIWAQSEGDDRTASTVMTHEHGITEAVVPNIECTAMFEPRPKGDYNWDATRERYVQVPAGTGTFVRGFYHARADLSVLGLAGGGWEAHDASGRNVTGAVARAVSIGSIYDARQANGSKEKILLTQIDLLKLGRSGMFPENGLLYAANYGEGTGLDARGIRLVNGGFLAGRLTVVTPDPVYIWGDFNTTNRKPAAVLCDTLNLLSSAWDGFKLPGRLPRAESTTYNVAVATGDSSCDLESLPRFHEDWSGKTCTIEGSIARIWVARFGTGAWAYGGDRYEAPTLELRYDPAFNDAANLPPFTPMAVSAVEIASW